VNLNATERLSVLSCVTGLALLAIFFAAVWLGVPSPEWLPMAISSIAGFELFMILDAVRRRRAGGGSHG
jgi:hypothetical protein